jgi:hypothetical protein
MIPRIIFLRRNNRVATLSLDTIVKSSVSHRACQIELRLTVVKSSGVETGYDITVVKSSARLPDGQGDETV